MNNTTTIGVDLAKDVIQVCVFRKGKITSNTTMTSTEFIAWLARQKHSTVVFEACATSNYWKQKANSLGHEAKLISAKLVSAIRQQQKNDPNDALAIVQASLLPEVNFIPGKTNDQQQLQAILRMRQLLVKQKTALGNQLSALLLEFNIRVSNRHGGLKGAVYRALEDANNGFSIVFRQALEHMWEQYANCLVSISQFDGYLNQLLNQTPQCKKLTKLEGVGVINAIHLYLALNGSELGVFKNGQQAAACIGLTPVQHSSGGKTKSGAINKNVKNSLLRSHLITSAFTYIHHVARRSAITQKDRWLQSLIERRGKKCAAVALANKTVRTAFALLHNDTEYVASP